jgi:hypothetical protein
LQHRCCRGDSPLCLTASPERCHRSPLLATAWLSHGTQQLCCHLTSTSWAARAITCVLICQGRPLSFLLLSPATSSPPRFFAKFIIVNPSLSNSPCIRVRNPLASPFHPLALPLLIGIALAPPSSSSDVRHATVSSSAWSSLYITIFFALSSVLASTRGSYCRALIVSQNALVDKPEHHRLPRSRAAALSSPSAPWFSISLGQPIVVLKSR